MSTRSPTGRATRSSANARCPVRLSADVITKGFLVAALCAFAAIAVSAILGVIPLPTLLALLALPLVSPIYRGLREQYSVALRPDGDDGKERPAARTGRHPAARATASASSLRTSESDGTDSASAAALRPSRHTWREHERVLRPLGDRSSLGVRGAAPGVANAPALLRCVARTSSGIRPMALEQPGTSDLPMERVKSWDELAD